MRFIAFSDTHTSLFLHRKVVEYAKKYKADLLVCAGDFTLYCNYWEEALIELQKAEIPMIFVPGNHEYRPEIIQKIEQYSFTINIDYKVHCFMDLNFIGLGASDYPREGNPIKDAMLRKHTKMILHNSSSPTVLLSHVPPKNTETAVPRFRQDAGSERSDKWLCDIQPSLVLCGHIHRPLAREYKVNATKIYNIACQCHLFEATPFSVNWLQELPFLISG